MRPSFGGRDCSIILQGTERYEVFHRNNNGKSYIKVRKWVNGASKAQLELSRATLEEIYKICVLGRIQEGIIRLPPSR